MYYSRLYDRYKFKGINWVFMENIEGGYIVNLSSVKPIRHRNQRKLDLIRTKIKSTESENTSPVQLTDLQSNTNQGQIYTTDPMNVHSYLGLNRYRSNIDNKPILIIIVH